MARQRKKSLGAKLSQLFVAIAVLAIAGLAAKTWLADHPQHNPFAPLDLRDPKGWATGTKLAALQTDTAACRAVLERSEVAFSVLEATGEGACLRNDRMVLGALSFSPAIPQTTCTVAVGLELWIAQDVQPLATEILGSSIARIEHLGTYNCRTIGGGERWSQHATGNAIDIAGFVLEDGRRISLLTDWGANGPPGDEAQEYDREEGSPEAQFLRAIRDRACDSFGTVLSPDYNAAHADHFHLDQGRAPAISVCR